MFTITSSLPNVLGYDGTPIATEAIDGVLADIQSYRQAILADN